MHTDRRDFLKGAVTGALGLGALNGVAAPASETPVPKTDRRRLGRIGDEVSILGLGLGSAFFTAFGDDPEGAAALLRHALAKGVNYWDTCRFYKNSEELVGPALKDVRKDVFMVSKSTTRTYDGFRSDLETSLKLLQTDHLDIYHIHNLQPKRDHDLAAIEKGAVRAARKARDEGLIRHFGVTGHSGAAILMEAIRRWDPDAVLTTFPVNRPDKGRYEDELVPLATERKMAVIAMKTLRHARNTDLKGSDLVRYAMGLKGIHTAIVGLDSQAHLDENAAMATGFKPLAPGKRAALQRHAERVLADWPAPWDHPDYCDGVPV